ncbi:MAG: sterol desaturase family protein [Desulfobulbaceae bacterium]|nr:sterol desaturase family protein [Desulfobulbaceae bacterium]
MEQTFANVAAIRLGCFAGILVTMALWEIIAPRRQLTQRKATRWANNLGLTLGNTILARLLLPTAAVGVALFAGERGWGLLNWLTLPGWLTVLLAIGGLDLAIYIQHRLFHRVALLWRLHRMHHTDLDLDVTSGARFHPLEILLSQLIKMGVVLLLGAPAGAVVAFEIILNGTAMFNHANVRLDLRIDRWLRLLVVTPDMHRVHHSVIHQETDSNFGFNFPWWDRLFTTYRAQPEAGHLAMSIGLTNYRDPKWLKINWMLLVPFVRAQH